jgi:hypothetical protein
MLSAEDRINRFIMRMTNNDLPEDEVLNLDRLVQ